MNMNAGRGAAGPARDHRLTADARGSALLPVMLLMLLFSVMVFGASIVTRIELDVAERYGRGAQGLYAAEAAVAVAMAELRPMLSWTPVLDGTRQSGYSQGAFTGARLLPGGQVLLCCGPGSAMQSLERDTAQSALAARRALRWRPFLWTLVDGLVPGAPPALFVVVWVADDERDGDGNVETDSNNQVLVRAEALEPSGTRRIVEVQIARAAPPAGGEVSEAEGPTEAESPEEEPVEGAGEEAETEGGPLTAIRYVRWREIR